MIEEEIDLNLQSKKQNAVLKRPHPVEIAPNDGDHTISVHSIVLEGEQAHLPKLVFRGI